MNFKKLGLRFLLSLIILSNDSAEAFPRNEDSCPDSSAITGIRYATKSNYQRLKTYPLSGRRPIGRPILVYIHGGGWRSGCKETIEKTNIVDFFHKEFQMPVVAIDFRPVDPQNVPYRNQKVRWYYQMADIAKALAWISKNAAELGGDPNHIVLLGYSSGAHSAALIASDKKYLQQEGLSPKIVKSVISLDVPAHDIEYAIDISYEERIPARGKNYRDNLTSVFSTTQSLQRKASTISYYENIEPCDSEVCRKQYPKFLIASATMKDGYEHNFTPRIAQEFVKVLQGKGLRVINLVKAGDHLGMVKDIGDEEDIITKAIRRILNDE